MISSTLVHVFAGDRKPEVLVERHPGGDKAAYTLNVLFLAHDIAMTFHDSIALDRLTDLAYEIVNACRKLQPPADDNSELRKALGFNREFEERTTAESNVREGEQIVADALRRGEGDKDRVATTREQFIANLRDAASQGDLKCKNWDVEGLLRDAAAMLEERTASNV